MRRGANRAFLLPAFHGGGSQGRASKAGETPVLRGRTSGQNETQIQNQKIIQKGESWLGLCAAADGPGTLLRGGRIMLDRGGFLSVR